MGHDLVKCHVCYIIINSLLYCYINNDESWSVLINVIFNLSTQQFSTNGYQIQNKYMLHVVVSKSNNQR